jgi:transcriptional regulator CtsR
MKIKVKKSKMVRVMMMRNLADEIERYIQQLLNQEHGGGIFLRRNDLAEKLSCVPSQISYVLTTRFTSDRGYIVESRRGSGGYVRICRQGPRRRLPNILQEKIGPEIDVRRLTQLLDEWQREALLSRREKEIIRVLLAGSYLPIDDNARATLLKNLISMLGEGFFHY